MGKPLAALASLALLAGGCAGFDADEFLYGTPAHRANVTRTSTDLQLCRYLRELQTAPRDLRRDWAQELARRGQSCANYTDILSVDDMTSSRVHTGGTAYYKGERISGANRICRYERAGGTFVVTFPVGSSCPVTVP